jgi:Ca-activated chloride channel family protein
LREQGQLQAAYKELKVLLALDPSYMKAKEAIKEIEICLGQRPGWTDMTPAEARRIIHEKTEQAKIETRARFRRAENCYKAFEFEDAIEEFTKVLEIVRWAPNNVDLAGYRERVEAYIHRCRKLKSLGHAKRLKALQCKTWGIAMSEERMTKRLQMPLEKAKSLTLKAKALLKTKMKRSGQPFLEDIGVDVRGLGNEKGKDAYLDDVTGEGYANGANGAPTQPPSSGVFFNNESYAALVDTPFRLPFSDPLSTFSIDVDTASYANIRRILNQGAMPPPDAVRVEEMINYFTYNFEPPVNSDPFSVRLEIAPCPWNKAHRLVHVGLKGRVVADEERPSCNLVFLLDKSGSMNEPNKMPLLKKAMILLADRLRACDRVAIVTYDAKARLDLPSTPCHERTVIRQAIERLSAKGSTHWSAGVEKAYEVASKNFIKGGVNRVILCTDGDFNVGVTTQTGIVRLIEEKAKTGVFLTALGFGMGNYKDANMEALADKGNGQAAYIDTFIEARKVLVEQMAGTLVTIAKDVKIQVEFNPSEVAAYRLIGYANRRLHKEDFNDDAKDAGEIGAGHVVTALYEIVPAIRPKGRPAVDALKYQKTIRLSQAAHSGEMLTLKIRHKAPDGKVSKLMTFSVTDPGHGHGSQDFRFAAAVASFGMLMRDSRFRGDTTFDSILALARSSLGIDLLGRRAEFIMLVEKAQNLARPMETKR